MQNRGDVLYNTGMRRLYDSRTFSVSTNADCDVGFSRLAASGIFAMGADYSLSGEPCLLPDCESDYDSVSETVTSGTILERKNPTQADYEEFFDELFETGVRTLVHISAGSEIADDYAAAVKASKNEMVKFPRCQLYVVDSHAFSAGLAPMLYAAIKMRDEGLDGAEAFVKLTALAENARTYFIPSDCEQTRARFPVGFYGRTLNVRPVCSFASKNKLAVLSRPRGNATSRAALARLAADAAVTEAFVSYGYDTDSAVALKHRLEELSPGVKVELNRTGLLADCLIGGDALVLGFIAPPTAND